MTDTDKNAGRDKKLKLSSFLFILGGVILLLSSTIAYLGKAEGHHTWQMPSGFAFILIGIAIRKRRERNKDR